jgi:hypothetical protein
MNRYFREESLVFRLHPSWKGKAFNLSVGTRHICDGCGIEHQTVTAIYLNRTNERFAYLCWDCEHDLAVKLAKDDDYHERCREAYRPLRSEHV